MKITFRLLATIILGTLLCACSQKTEIKLVPLPQEVIATDGCFVIDNNTSITGNADFEIKYLKEKLSKGASIQVKDGAEGKKVIEIKIDPQSTVGKEGYTLSVLPDKISIAASDNGGAFYGVQTLLQLMPAEIYSEGGKLGKIKVPCVEIEDAPRFGYRGAGRRLGGETP